MVVVCEVEVDGCCDLCGWDFVGYEHVVFDELSDFSDVLWLCALVDCSEQVDPEWYCLKME